MTTPPSRRALVVRGGWDGHEPVQTTDHIAGRLETNGYELVISDDTAPYADAALMADIDLVVHCITGGEITADEMTGLTDAVAAGTGLAGWHGGITGSFPGNTTFMHLVGGVFAAHPAGPSTPDDNGPPSVFVRHRVTFTEAGHDHPATRGLEDFELVSENYWLLTDDYVDVLATTTQPTRPDTPWHRPVTSPAVWVRHWGEGRIFVATPGHDLATVTRPEVTQLIERGLAWASR
ncbi:ThuA domain-containing protein [Propionibacteriaceae bacterium Y2011]